MTRRLFCPACGKTQDPAGARLRFVLGLRRRVCAKCAKPKT